MPSVQQGREPKTCVVCGRSITWRKKWARDWAQVTHCSQACRRSGVRPVDVALEGAMLRLLDARPAGATICPSEAARLVASEAGGDAGDDGWRDLMEPARAAARRLVVRDEVDVVQGGRVVDPSRARGPVRIRTRRRG